MGKQELLDRARDELFSHIHRCGVLQASESDQDSWMSETIEYLAERYPDLSEPELGELKAVGMRFCQPVISRLARSEPEEDQTVSSNGAASGEAGDTEQPQAETAVAVETERVVVSGDDDVIVAAETEEVAVGAEAGVSELTAEVSPKPLD